MCCLRGESTARDRWENAQIVVRNSRRAKKSQWLGQRRTLREDRAHRVCAWRKPVRRPFDIDTKHGWELLSWFRKASVGPPARSPARRSSARRTTGHSSTSLRHQCCSPRSSTSRRWIPAMAARRRWVSRRPHICILAHLPTARASRSIWKTQAAGGLGRWSASEGTAPAVDVRSTSNFRFGPTTTTSLSGRERRHFTQASRRVRERGSAHSRKTRHET
jgi:hypothetical protein